MLPYIISQKTEKAVKKGVGIVPGASLLTNTYRLGRFLFKKDRGKKRGFYAYVLTRHLITHDCMLAGAIVAELFSDREMLTLRRFDSDESSPVIARKMKSVLRVGRRGPHGAGDGNRTRIASLEGWGSTIELHPRGAGLPAARPARNLIPGRVMHQGASWRTPGPGVIARCHRPGAGRRLQLRRRSFVRLPLPLWEGVGGGVVLTRHLDPSPQPPPSRGGGDFRFVGCELATDALRPVAYSP